MNFFKKMFFYVFLGFFLVGCGKNNGESIVNDLSKKIKNIDSYNLNGVLEIINNENSYLYDVNVSYKKDNNFKVSLKNKTNNHEQVILRNADGVYVLTPSLNKSFKFQSDWPYNNSQSYLLNNLLNDINNDNDYIFESNDTGYIITTKVNYSNNKDLVQQKIYINKDKNIYMVEIFDSSGIVKMKMNIDNIDYNYSFDDDYFDLNKNMTVSSDVDISVSKIDDIIYPMYVPKNTHLSSQDRVSLESGERVIMTFSGDYPFMLIQETINGIDTSVLSVSGEPLQLSSSIGIIDDSSITWIEDSVLYYLVSNTLDRGQLIDVANSLTVASIEK